VLCNPAPSVLSLAVTVIVFALVEHVIVAVGAVISTYTFAVLEAHIVELSALSFMVYDAIVDVLVDTENVVEPPL